VRDAPRRSLLECAVGAAIGAMILVSVLAAGSIVPWLDTARSLRWLVLLVLVALSLLYACRRRGRVAPRPFVLAAAGLALLAALSVFWSAEPWVTVQHAGVFGFLLLGASALAFASAGSPAAVERLVDGVLVGLFAVAIGGLLVLAFDRGRAIDPATTELAARYQGLGGGPNTATMVLALGVPLAAGAALVGAGWRRIAAFVLLGLLVGSIVASGSRGALAAAFAGLLALALLAPRRTAVRGAALVGVAAAAGLAVLVTRLPEPLPPGTPSRYVAPHPDVVEIEGRPGYVDANVLMRLQDDIGHPGLGTADTRKRSRTLVSSSGRLEAWGGTLQLIADRPLVGYGFGLEEEVFVDRYVNFNSDVPENSYLGLLLQLGVLGALALAAIVGVSGVLTARALRRAAARHRALVASCAGTVVAGLVLGLFQSFFYAVGNNATATFWISVFLLAALSVRQDGALRGQ
jgi:hypothetical protein